jgi:hypothetical protein
MQDEDGGLVAGVAGLPGMPLAVGVQPASVNGNGGERFVRAFLLPAVPAVHEDASIVLPAGMYQASRILEVSSGAETLQLRMKHVVQRGLDFDRISYDSL